MHLCSACCQNLAGVGKPYADPASCKPTLPFSVTLTSAMLECLQVAGEQLEVMEASGLDQFVPSDCIVVLFRHAYARTVSRQAMELLTTAGGACEEGLRLEGVHSAGRAQVLLQLLDQGVQLDHAGRAEEGLGHPLRRQGQPSQPWHPQRAGALPARKLVITCRCHMATEQLRTEAENA